MLGRLSKGRVLAEVPAPGAGSPRAGALGRAQLEALSGLAATLSGRATILTTGPAGSRVALGLAAVSVAEGRRVALVECDLAAPSLAATLGLAEVPGLHEYLRGDAEAPQILQSLVLAGPASGRAAEPLACIVAGEPEPEPVSLLDSERCDHAIQRLRRAYDLVVIDGPPLSEEADSLRALAEHADAVLACGARGDVPRKPPIRLTGLVLSA